MKGDSWEARHGKDGGALIGNREVRKRGLFGEKDDEFCLEHSEFEMLMRHPLVGIRQFMM